MLRHSKRARKQIYEVIKCEVRKEIKQLSAKSVAFRMPPNVDNMEKFSWGPLIQESQKIMPCLHAAIEGVFTTQRKTDTVIVYAFYFPDIIPCTVVNILK